MVAMATSKPKLSGPAAEAEAALDRALKNTKVFLDEYRSALETLMTRPRDYEMTAVEKQLIHTLKELQGAVADATGQAAKYPETRERAMRCAAMGMLGDMMGAECARRARSKEG